MPADALESNTGFADSAFSKSRHIRANLIGSLQVMEAWWLAVSGLVTAGSYLQGNLLVGIRGHLLQMIHI